MLLLGTSGSRTSPDPPPVNPIESVPPVRRALLGTVAESVVDPPVDAPLLEVEAELPPPHASRIEPARTTAPAVPAPPRSLRRDNPFDEETSRSLVLRGSL